MSAQRETPRGRTVGGESRTRRIEIREVLVHLGLDQGGLLERLRDEGLFESEHLDSREADELRVAVLMMNDLGVNPAGVHVALHLRRRLMTLEARVASLRGLDSERDRASGEAPHSPGTRDRGEG